MKCTSCGSYAINENMHGRKRGVRLDLCDVCYWRAMAEGAMANQCGEQVGYRIDGHESYFILEPDDELKRNPKLKPVYLKA